MELVLYTYYRLCRFLGSTKSCRTCLLRTLMKLIGLLSLDC